MQLRGNHNPLGTDLPISSGRTCPAKPDPAYRRPRGRRFRACRSGPRWADDALLGAVAASRAGNAVWSCGAGGCLSLRGGTRRAACDPRSASGGWHAAAAWSATPACSKLSRARDCSPSTRPARSRRAEHMLLESRAMVPGLTRCSHGLPGWSVIPSMAWPAPSPWLPPRADIDPVPTRDGADRARPRHLRQTPKVRPVAAGSGALMRDVGWLLPPALAEQGRSARGERSLRGVCRLGGAGACRAVARRYAGAGGARDGRSTTLPRGSR